MLQNPSVIAVLAIVATLTYAAATVPVFTSKGDWHNSRLPLLLGLLAALLHACIIGVEWATHGGLSSSFFDALSGSALIVVLITLALQFSQHLAALLLPVYLIAALSVALAAGFGHYSPINASSPGLLLHISSAITGYGLLCLAALYALVVRTAERGLRKGRQGPWLNALPPLEALERHLFSVLLATWIVVGVSIVFGALYVDNLLAQHLVHKTVFTLLSWIVLGALLAGRHWYGWRGRIAVRWTLVAFGLLAVGFLGSKFVLDVVLDQI